MSRFFSIFSTFHYFICHSVFFGYFKLGLAIEDGLFSVGFQQNCFFISYGVIEFSALAGSEKSQIGSSETEHFQICWLHVCENREKIQFLKWNTVTCNLLTAGTLGKHPDPKLRHDRGKTTVISRVWGTPFWLNF